jgi:hypothetical protein
MVFKLREISEKKKTKKIRTKFENFIRANVFIPNPFLISIKFGICKNIAEKKTKIRKLVRRKIK